MITRLEDGAQLPDSRDIARLTEALGGHVLVDHDGLIDRKRLDELNAEAERSRAEETHYWDAEDMLSAERLLAVVNTRPTLTTTNAYEDLRAAWDKLAADPYNWGGPPR
ncbi:hypothetical protein [Embleya sp. NPDC005971]|uniref:hypothetical protein n=1 Tax=Embleya sp. NPDC005971 TaxID=3156724 RepID=UPI0033D06425